MAKITPIIQKMEENCEVIAVSMKVEQLAQEKLARLRDKCSELNLLITAARQKRARARRENEALNFYQAGQKHNGKVVSLREFRNRTRHKVTYHTTANQKLGSDYDRAA